MDRDAGSSRCARSDVAPRAARGPSGTHPTAGRGRRCFGCARGDRCRRGSRSSDYGWRLSRRSDIRGRRCASHEANQDAGSKDRGKGDKGGDKEGNTNVPITERTITAVGDSVLLGARLALQERMSKLHVDAEISRQPYDTLSRIRERLSADAMADVLVIQTGTNGVPVEEDLRSVLEKLHELDRVVLVNVRSPVPWMDQSNRILESAARRIRQRRGCRLGERICGGGELLRLRRHPPDAEGHGGIRAGST